jgi:hypothetical protein
VRERTGLVVDTTDVEALSVGEECCMTRKLLKCRYSRIDEPLPLTETGGVFALVTAVTRFSMVGVANTDDTRAEAARNAVEVFIIAEMMDCRVLEK